MDLYGRNTHDERFGPTRKHAFSFADFLVLGQLSLAPGSFVCLGDNLNLFAGKPRMILFGDLYEDVINRRWLEGAFRLAFKSTILVAGIEQHREVG